MGYTESGRFFPEERHMYMRPTIRRARYVISLLCALLCALASLALPPAPGALLASGGGAGIGISVNGVIMEGGAKPFIENSRVMVPLRSIVEYLDGKVLWYPEEQQVIGFRGARGFDLTIGSGRATLSDGTVRTLDVPALIVGGRTYVPLRFVSEAMGCEVSWDDAARVVYIKTGPIDAKGEVEALARPTLVQVSSEKGTADGFFYTKDGIVITCAEVAHNAAGISVTTGAGAELRAEALTVDTLLGLAKLRVGREPGETFPVFRYFDDFDGVQDGEAVFMYGASRDGAPALEAGLVTAKRGAEAGRGGIGTYDVSPAITASNRGGPVVKSNGAIIGVARFTDQDGGADAYVVPIENVFKMKHR